MFHGGDQPKAIEQLVKGIKNNEKSQVLLGVTGSGKTFTKEIQLKWLSLPLEQELRILTTNFQVTQYLFYLVL